MRTFSGWAIIIVFAGAAVSSACARHSAPSLNDRLVRDGQPKIKIDTPEAPKASLDEYIGKVRELSARARPAPKPLSPTVESTNPDIAAALAKVAVAPTPENHREAAEAYRRLGLLDRAYGHLM